ncbi:hypothetical protein, partial [Acidithiobacillus thiooxidans]|uniref:hypothetical protein n=1 Tax=Acidithiobacillus thiooxidans TaxID=930 RepID=UPI001C065818
DQYPIQEAPPHRHQTLLTFGIHILRGQSAVIEKDPRRHRQSPRDDRAGWSAAFCRAKRTS